MAIAFDTGTDASQNAGVGSATSLTWAHTVTGTDPVLLVGGWFEHVGGTPVITATYNSVAMTELYQSSTNPFSWAVFYLKAPATGANNIVVSSTGGTGNSYRYFVATSYTGVDQTTPIDASDTPASFAATQSISDSITTVTDNAWAILFHERSGAGVVTATAPAVRRRQNLESSTAEDNAWLDGGGPKTPAGAATIAYTTNVNVTGNTLPFALRPSAASSSIKTWNGLADASTKTYDGLASASIKNFNGLA